MKQIRNICWKHRTKIRGTHRSFRFGLWLSMLDSNNNTQNTIESTEVKFLRCRRTCQKKNEDIWEELCIFNENLKNPNMNVNCTKTWTVRKTAELPSKHWLEHKLGKEISDVLGSCGSSSLFHLSEICFQPIYWRWM